jgi:hypothetical protein
MRRVAAVLLAFAPLPAHALGQLLPTPAGSGAFGTQVVYLPNGNFVVTDPEWTDGTQAQVGAVYLYGANGNLISRLTGSKTDDLVGAGGIVVLANGNFIVHSPFWDSSASAFDVGAVSFGNATIGFSAAQAEVSVANSLVGTQTNDRVGSPQTLALPNGHYVVVSDHWNRGQLQAAGAVTWSNGNTGTFGAVSAANSLVGTSAGDHVGLHVIVLANGNYVVASPLWDAGTTQDVGAVTWRPADAALPAEVSAANSAVGSTAWTWSATLA